MTKLGRVGAACAAVVATFGVVSGANAQSTSWSGFYMGLNAGYGWGDSDVSNSVCATAANCYFGTVGGASVNNAGGGNISDKGFTGGGQLGLNFQNGALVYGLEADLNYVNFSANRTVRVPYAVGSTVGVDLTDTTSADYLATIRARLGFASGAALFYVTGGLALTNLKHSHAVSEYGFGVPATVSGCFGSNWCDRGGSSSSTKTGWALGGGIEYALSRSWTVKGEYLYADFGKINGTTSFFTPAGVAVANSTIGHSADLVMQSVRLGVNYRF